MTSRFCATHCMCCRGTSSLRVSQEKRISTSFWAHWQHTGDSFSGLMTTLSWISWLPVLSQWLNMKMLERREVVQGHGRPHAANSSFTNFFFPFLQEAIMKQPVPPRQTKTLQNAGLRVSSSCNLLCTQVHFTRFKRFAVRSARRKIAYQCLFRKLFLIFITIWCMLKVRLRTSIYKDTKEVIIASPTELLRASAQHTATVAKRCQVAFITMRAMHFHHILSFVATQTGRTSMTDRLWELSGHVTISRTQRKIVQWNSTGSKKSLRNMLVKEVLDNANCALGSLCHNFLCSIEADFELGCNMCARLLQADGGGLFYYSLALS